MSNTINFLQMFSNPRKEDFSNERRYSIANLLADVLGMEYMIVWEALQGSELSVCQASGAAWVATILATVGCDGVGDLVIIPPLVIGAGVKCRVDIVIWGINWYA
jgi:hypothetical protein